MEFNLKNVFIGSVVTGATVAAYFAVPCTGLGFALSNRASSDFFQSAAICTAAGAMLGTPVGMGKFAVGLTALGFSTAIIKGAEGIYSVSMKGMHSIHQLGKRIILS